MYLKYYLSQVKPEPLQYHVNPHIKFNFMFLTINSTERQGLLNGDLLLLKSTTRD